MTKESLIKGWLERRLYYFRPAYIERSLEYCVMKYGPLIKDYKHGKAKRNIVRKIIKDGHFYISYDHPWNEQTNTERYRYLDIKP